MSFLQDRRDRKFEKLARDQSTAAMDDGKKARRHARENRIRDLKKMIPLAIGIVLGGFISRGLLQSVVPGGTALIIAVLSSVSAFLIIWVVTIRTYIPPGVMYTQFGHVNKDDINSMVYSGDILIPKDLITNIHQNAPNYEILRSFGVSNLIESFEWNDETGDVTIKSPEGVINELAFFERHKTFHEQEKIIQIQGETINNYEKYVKVELPRLAFKMAEDMINKVAASFFDPVAGERIGKELKTELERQKRDILDLTYGPRTGGSNPPMTGGENVQQ